MPGFSDTAVIALIALLLFGPKKLPVLARQLGKLMAEFRRASNDFRSQMEEELRIAEQADRQKEVAALEAATTNTISPPAGPDMALHTPPEAPNFATPAEGEAALHPTAEFAEGEDGRCPEMFEATGSHVSDEHTPAPAPVESMQTTPIATSGDLNLMPPETGLPIARSNSASISNGSTSSVTTPPEPTEPHQPATHTSPHEAELEPETLHG